MSTKQKCKTASCRCCGVNFDPTICTQCQVAGCAANAKGDRCRLSTIALGVQKLSPAQLRIKHEELQNSYNELLVESQRLARLLYQYESGQLKTFLDGSPPSATPTGKLSPAGAITVVERRV